MVEILSEFNLLNRVSMGPIILLNSLVLCLEKVMPYFISKLRCMRGLLG